jgi:arylsulfatase A
MHVPLIANWPRHVVAGKVYSDLVDTTDFVPTLLDAAGAKAPPSLKFDGRSFLPQLRGEKGQPREWIYSWYSPRQGEDLTVREFAFDQRFKLYRSGKFFDLEKDPEEKSPIEVATLTGEAVVAAKRLQGALNQFTDARPPGLDRPGAKAGKAKNKAKRQETKS